jgi:arabinose-5-phosphate isomerase
MLIDLARKVLEVEAEAIRELLDRLNQDFERAVDIVYRCQGRVVTTGMGKSGIICQKIAATLSSSGTASYFLHPAEATHGDLGRLRGDDVVLALSNSGETEEIVCLLPLIKRLGIPLISLCGNLSSTLARASDVVLDVGIRAEACPLNLVPTASTTAALAMGDALAMALLVRRGFTQEEFAAIHPGGRLGRKLLRVRDLMHTGSQLPRVSPKTRMDEAILEMSRKGFGITTVVDEQNRLLGIITDGDLRRLMQRAGDQALAVIAAEVMTPNPRVIDRDEFATAALRIMEQYHITSLLIVDSEHRLEGLLHLHDLWRTEMI